MGGGGGGGRPTSTTTYSSNIPEYAQPYVEQMLGAAFVVKYSKGMHCRTAHKTVIGCDNQWFDGFRRSQAAERFGSFRSDMTVYVF